MYREEYIHCRQNQAFEQYRGGILLQKEIEKTYEEIDYKIRRPDLLGKTVQVTAHQFPTVNELVKSICEYEQMECPPVYVYEDYYYGAESYGIREPWIELSAKTIQDFSEEELGFVLGREIYKIADGVTGQKTMMEERFHMIRQMAPNQLEQASRISFYHWYRIANYSADNYGYLQCGNIQTAVNAILKMVLNSIGLADQVDIREFIGQASEINRLDDDVFNYTKADEPVPYAPHRIQNLMAYAISERGLRARETMERWKRV